MSITRAFITNILICLILVSCSKDETNNDNNRSDSIPQTLHIYFEAANWKREIDCSRLVLTPVDSDGENYYVIASSESTAVTFRFSYPNTATELSKSSHLKKYAVSDFTDLNAPFQLAMKLPIDAGKIDPANGRLVSNAGFSDTEYTEIVKIEPAGKEGEYAVFEIQGRYAFKARIVDGAGTGTENSPVKGTFKFRIFAEDK